MSALVHHLIHPQTSDDYRNSRFVLGMAVGIASLIAFFIVFGAYNG
jgi:hypothetical protein